MAFAELVALSEILIGSMQTACCAKLWIDAHSAAWPFYIVLRPLCINTQWSGLLAISSPSWCSHSLSLASWILQVRKSFCTKPIWCCDKSSFLSENPLPDLFMQKEKNARGNESNRFFRTKFMASMACNRFSISRAIMPCFFVYRKCFFLISPRRGRRGILRR